MIKQQNLGVISVYLQMVTLCKPQKISASNMQKYVLKINPRFHILRSCCELEAFLVVLIILSCFSNKSEKMMIKCSMQSGRRNDAFIQRFPLLSVYGQLRSHSLITTTNLDSECISVWHDQHTDESEMQRYREFHSLRTRAVTISFLKSKLLVVLGGGVLPKSSGNAVKVSLFSLACFPCH